MDNRRADDARAHDDSTLIDNAEPAPPHGGRSGGNLKRDVVTQAELERVRDPEASEGVDKQDDINHQQRYENRRPADKPPGGSGSE